MRRLRVYDCATSEAPTWQNCHGPAAENDAQSAPEVVAPRLLCIPSMPANAHPVVWPRVSGGACVRALLRDGFKTKLANEKGTALSRDGRLVLVPPQEELSEAELRLILFAAQMTPEKFASLIEAPVPEHGASGVRLRDRDRDQTSDDEPPLFSRPYVHHKAGR